MSSPAPSSLPLSSLGVTVMPEWFQWEGIEPVLDRLQALGATALATSPYVMAPCTDGEGAREPPADGDAGKVRPLDRPLWGRRELWVRTAPCFVHDAARYRGLRYQPSPPDPLTLREGAWLDRLLVAAAARGIDVYLQVMAASPPAYRVQFSNAVAEDRCLGPDGQPHEKRVDRNASLASAHVVDYLATLLVELAERYPRVVGFRLDWPEYPPYDFRSALFDFNPAARRLMTAAGHDPVAVARAVSAWSGGIALAARSAITSEATAAADALLAAGWNALHAETGALAPLFDAKRGAALGLLRRCRAALDSVGGARRRLEAQAFPPPFSRMSGFPLDALEGQVDAVGIKLYTMHWPMIARYWARDLLGDGGRAGLDTLTAAIAHCFGFTDAIPRGARALAYPEPHQPHPVGVEAQAEKLAQACKSAAPVPVIAFAHTYGPLADVVARCRIAAGSGLPVWLNRYGYLSDEKLDALSRARH